MDVAGLSHERGARSSATHRSASTRDRRVRRGLIDQRIDECQRKIATAEAKGDVDAVADCRRLVRIAEDDRRTLDALIDKLRRRFVRRTPGAGPR